MVSGSQYKDDQGKCGGKMADLECLYANRGVLSGQPHLYLIGDQVTDEKILQSLGLLSWLRCFIQDHLTCSYGKKI